MRIPEQLLTLAPEDFTLYDDAGQLELRDSPLSGWLAEQLRPLYKYSGALGWFRYDGKRWLRVSSDRMLAVTQKAFTELYVKEAIGASADRRKQLASLLNRSKIAAVTALLRGLLEQNAADFDSIENAHLLNTQSGVVDLRTGELLPHDPDLLFTKITRARYIPGATHPDWDKALEAFADEDTHRWVQAKMGQAITGQPPTDDRLMILFGGGSNGKSALLECRKSVGDYSTSMSDRLVHSLPSHHPTELTDLKGVRMAVLEELPSGKLNTRRVKSMVGSTEITARKIAKDDMTWLATHSLVITTNWKPQVSERDHGTWRRLALVTFPYTFVPGDRPLEEGERRGDETLRDRLGAGRDGRDEAMLSWLVEGAMAVYGGGHEQHLPAPPARVRADTDEWRKGEDHLARFVDEHLVFDPAWVTLRSDVYRRYQLWAEARGLKAENDQAFTEAFLEHDGVRENGVRESRCRLRSRQVSMFGPGKPPEAGRVWVGIRFRDADDETD